MAFENDLDDVLHELRTMLIEKNRLYGDSALRPNPITSVASAIKLRMLDKMRRIESGQPDEDEDVWFDLLGYGVLLQIARHRAIADDVTRIMPAVVPPPTFDSRLPDTQEMA
jgi:hypothetical protein